MSQQEEVLEEEESKEQRRKEAFQIGRLLGVVKRRDPELYEDVVRIAESEGKKATEIVIEALYVWRDYKMMIGIDGRCLAYALNVLDMLMKRLMHMMLTINQYFTSEFFQQQLEIMAEIQQRQQAIMQQAYQQAKKEEKNKVLAPIKEQLVTNLTNMILNMVMNMLSSMMTAFRPACGAPSGTPTPAPQPIAPAQVFKPKKKPKLVEQE